MRHRAMGRRWAGVVVASVVLLSGCGGTAPETAETAAGDATDAAEDAAEDMVEPTEPTEPGPGESSPAAGAGGDAGPTVLQGRVGTPEDPEAFVISLTTEDGEPVTTLPAGDYTIEVVDPATQHNFHLVGGSVDETTSVPEKEETTFEVTLEEGEYTYRCDPHPSMTGTFTVTS